MQIFFHIHFLLVSGVCLTTNQKSQIQQSVYSIAAFPIDKILHMTLLFNSESADTFFHYLDADFILHRFVFNLKQQAIRHEVLPNSQQILLKKKHVGENCATLFPQHLHETCKALATPLFQDLETKWNRLEGITSSRVCNQCIKPCLLLLLFSVKFLLVLSYGLQSVKAFRSTET